MNITKRNELISQHISLVHRLAKLHKSKILYLSQVTLDDLIAAGNLGLVEAAENYNEEMGCSFAAFAQKRIFGEMCNEIGRHSHGPKGGSFVVYASIETTEFSHPSYEEDFEETIFETVSKVLTKREAAVVWWYFVDEMTYKQIGEKIGVRESRVCQILSDALSRLHKVYVSHE